MKKNTFMMMFIVMFAGSAVHAQSCPGIPPLRPVMLVPAVFGRFAYVGLTAPTADGNGRARRQIVGARVPAQLNSILRFRCRLDHRC